MWPQYLAAILVYIYCSMLWFRKVYLVAALGVGIDGDSRHCYSLVKVWLNALRNNIHREGCHILWLDVEEVALGDGRNLLLEDEHGTREACRGNNQP